MDESRINKLARNALVKLLDEPDSVNDSRLLTLVREQRIMDDKTIGQTINLLAEKEIDNLERRPQPVGPTANQIAAGIIAELQMREERGRVFLQSARQQHDTIPAVKVAAVKTLAGKRPSANSRMIDTLQRQPESKDWSCEQWRVHLEVRSKATVHDTPTWKALQLAKAGVAMQEIHSAADAEGRRLGHHRRKRNRNNDNAND